jgi:hypothetical protein
MYFCPFALDTSSAINETQNREMSIATSTIIVAFTPLQRSWTFILPQS